MKLEVYRKKLEQIDKKIILLLNERMAVSHEIGKLKLQNQIEPKQNEFWKLSSAKRMELVLKTALDPDFVEKIYKLIRVQSLKRQKQIINKIEK